MCAKTKNLIGNVDFVVKRVFLFCKNVNEINMDWKDSLSALKGTLPQGDPEPVVEEKVEEMVNSQNLIVSFEKKGRGGKAATIISGFTCDLETVRQIADTLKKKLATGGSYREEEILIQGDKRDAAVECLKKMGHKAKRGN